MKKYVNGEYIEMTPEEVVAWEEAQKVVEDSEGGGYKLIREIALEEDGLIEPITDVDYAAVKVRLYIPETPSASYRVLISTSLSGNNGYVRNTDKIYAMTIIREFDAEKYERPRDFLFYPDSWLGKWTESFGRELTPKRINTIHIGLGDSKGSNFPARTTVKIYAKE